MQFLGGFALGDRVYIDGDTSLTAVVTGVCFREESYTCEVQWIHSGANHCAWMPPMRISAA